MEGGEGLLVMWMIRVLFVVISSLVGYICCSHLHVSRLQGFVVGLCFRAILEAYNPERFAGVFTGSERRPYCSESSGISHVGYDTERNK